MDSVVTQNEPQKILRVFLARLKNYPWKILIARSFWRFYISHNNLGPSGDSGLTLENGAKPISSSCGANRCPTFLKRRVLS